MLEERVYLLLGSNLGERSANLDLGEKYLDLLVGRVTKRSHDYQTKAWGLQEQPDFINRALELETSLKPEDILAKIRQIEGQLERVRQVKWGPRTLDIDILLYGDHHIVREDLVIPQLLLEERRFTLKPLAEIAAEVIHPIFSKNIRDLLRECNDPLEASILNYADEV